MRDGNTRTSRSDGRVQVLEFGDGGALALVASDTRTAVFRATDGELVASDRSASDAISPDGAFVADAADEGSLAILDLRTGTRVALQDGHAPPARQRLAYGPTADILVAKDREGDVQVVRCEICAGEDALAACPYEARPYLALRGGALIGDPDRLMPRACAVAPATV